MVPVGGREQSPHFREIHAGLPSRPRAAPLRRPLLAGGLLPNIVRPVLGATRRRETRCWLAVASSSHNPSPANSRRQRPSVERLLPTAPARSRRWNCRPPLARSARRYAVHEQLEHRVAQLAQRPLDVRPGREPAALAPFHPHRPPHVRTPFCSVSRVVRPASDEWGLKAL